MAPCDKPGYDPASGGALHLPFCSKGTGAKQEEGINGFIKNYALWGNWWVGSICLREGRG